MRHMDDATFKPRGDGELRKAMRSLNKASIVTLHRHTGFVVAIESSLNVNRATMRHTGRRTCNCKAKGRFTI